MKTPDKIKKGLECCFNEDNLDFVCGECPYDEAGSECGNLFGDALAYIEQLEAAVPRWISVEERLPESRGVYIAHIVHRYCKVDSYSRVCIEYFDTDNTWASLHDIYEVTHWMPLPEPPEV